MYICGMLLSSLHATFMANLSKPNGILVHRNIHSFAALTHFHSCKANDGIRNQRLDAISQAQVLASVDAAAAGST